MAVTGSKSRSCNYLLEKNNAKILKVILYSEKLSYLQICIVIAANLALSYMETLMLPMKDLPPGLKYDYFREFWLILLLFLIITIVVLRLNPTKLGQLELLFGRNLKCLTHIHWNPHSMGIKLVIK